MGLRACFKLWSVVTIGLGLLAPSLRAEFVFVANADSNTVSAYRIGENGTLKPVAGSPFSAGTGSNSVAVDPLGRFVYVANSGSYPAFDGSVSGYRIGANGALTSIAGSVPVGSNPRSVAVDKSGRFVYVANAGSSTVSAYRIDPASGALTSVPGSPFPAGTGPNSVAFGP